MGGDKKGVTQRQGRWRKFEFVPGCQQWCRLAVEGDIKVCFGSHRCCQGANRNNCRWTMRFQGEGAMLVESYLNRLRPIQGQGHEWCKGESIFRIVSRCMRTLLFGSCNTD